MRNPRGFQYPLEPLQRKSEWDLNDITLELAALNQTVSEQQTREQELTHRFATTRADWMRQVNKQPLNIDSQRLTYGYLAQLQERISVERERLLQLEQQRDEVIRRSHELRKFADGIERHRDEAILEHEKERARLAFKDADDIWLQRMHWGKKR